MRRSELATRREQKGDVATALLEREGRYIEAHGFEALAGILLVEQFLAIREQRLRSAISGKFQDHPARTDVHRLGREANSPQPQQGSDANRRHRSANHSTSSSSPDGVFVAELSNELAH
jgi:hypothetical protein